MPHVFHQSSSSKEVQIFVCDLNPSFKSYEWSSNIFIPFLWKLSITFTLKLQITNWFSDLKVDLIPHILLIKFFLKKFDLSCLIEVWTTAKITTIVFLLWVFDFDYELLSKSRFFFQLWKDNFIYHIFIVWQSLKIHINRPRWNSLSISMVSLCGYWRKRAGRGPHQLVRINS
jgi:hypothetical protein